MNRRSLIPARRYKISTPTFHCVGCRRPVTPGLCYTGQVLTGFQWITKEHESLMSIYPVQYGIREVRHEIPTYKRGFICDVCDKNYKHIDKVYPDKHDPLISHTVSYPIVKLDPAPGFDQRIDVESMRALQTL